MHMKKSVLAIFAASLLLLSLAGCGIQPDSQQFHGGNNAANATNTDGQGAAKGEENMGGLRIIYSVDWGENGTYTDADISEIEKQLYKQTEKYSTQALISHDNEGRICVEFPGMSLANKEIAEEMVAFGDLYMVRQFSDKGELNFEYVFGLDDADGAGFYILNFDIDELQNSGSIILDGHDIKEAQAGVMSDATGVNSYVISLTMTDEGTEKFASATAEAAENNEAIAIVYDGMVVSAPRVNSVITDGNVQISGMDSYEEAEKIASSIRNGGIDYKLKVESVSEY